MYQNYHCAVLMKAQMQNVYYVLEQMESVKDNMMEFHFLVRLECVLMLIMSQIKIVVTINMDV